MGDRRSIIVKHDNGLSVALYTHWSGYKVPELLAGGLRKAGRSDAAYLTRILMDTLTELSGTTSGFGIEPFATGSDEYCEAAPGYDPIVHVSDQVIELDGEMLTFDEWITEYGEKENA